MRRTQLPALAAVLAFLSACSKDMGTAPPTVASVHVTPGADTLGTLGRTLQLSATALDGGGKPMSGVTIVWRSSAPLVMRVDSVTGLATAVANGSATISAVAAGISGNAVIAVQQVVATVQVTPNTRTMTTVGATVQLTATAKDSGGATVPGVPFLWVSSNPLVATVDTLGIATSRGSGQATITAAGRGVPGNAVLTVNQVAQGLVFVTPPSSTIAGEAINPAIQVEVHDSAGHLVTTSRAAVTLASMNLSQGAVTLHGSTTVNAVGGVATFSGLTIEQADLQTLIVATSGGTSADTSPMFPVYPAAPASALMAVPDSVRDGALLGASATLYDRFGNMAWLSSIPVTLGVARSRWGGHLVGTLTVAAVGGNAVFPDVRFSSPGSFTLQVLTGATVLGTADSTVQRLTFAQVTTGADFSCGRTAAATFCWGANNVGQLGDGTLRDDSVPTLVDPGVTFTSITSREQASCGLTSGGAAYCWGNVAFVHDSAPVAVPGGQAFTSLAAGATHYCGLVAGGAAWCWGTNFYGELGDSSQNFSATPVAVHGGLAFLEITAGAGFTCGIASSSHRAYCWGYNLNGQLGNGTTDTALAPVAVANVLFFSNVQAGNSHACGIDAGDVYCWGSDFAGQTGDTLYPYTDSLPGLVPGGLQFTSVVAGGTHSCGIDQYGNTSCWGSNYFGELGTFGSGAIPRGVGGLYVQLAAAYGRTCGITATGQAYCWGENSTGAIGDGTKTNRAAPQPVTQ